MEYAYRGEKYVLNLIDTRGIVDFSYEVSRAIASCEGRCWWSMLRRGFRLRPFRTCILR